MMRGILFLVGCSLLTVLAYWAYSENYKTQAEIERVEALRFEIADRREAIAILTAEWAYLNRPDRLRRLADMNFETLKLIPMTSEHFGTLADLPTYTPPAPLLPEAQWVSEDTPPAPRVTDGGHYP